MNTSINNINFSTKFLMGAICFFVFLDLFIPAYRVYWLVMLVLADIIYVALQKNMKLFISLPLILLFIFCLISAIGLNNNSVFYVTGNMTYFAMLTICFLQFILLSSDQLNWQRFFLKYVYYIYLFFLVGSLLQLIFPSVVSRINNIVMSPDQFNSSVRFISSGLLSGFTFNTALNGFILSIGLLLTYIKLYNHGTSKIFNIIIFTLTYYLIFLTGKRGFILFVTLIIVYLTIKLSKNPIKILSFVIMIAITAYAFLIFTEAGQNIILRTQDQTDISSGRITVYNQLWNDFLKYPILGNGTYTTNSVVHIFNGHNIYLQVLRENGILGFLFLSIFMIYNLYKTNKLITNETNMEVKSYLLFSISVQMLFLMWGLTGNPLYDGYSLITYFISCAMIIPITNIEKNTSNVKKGNYNVENSNYHTQWLF